MMSQLNKVSAIADFDQALNRVVGKSPDWLKSLREKSALRFQELGIPTVKDEEWKYTNLSALAAQSFVSAEESQADVEDVLKNYADDAIRLVFVNGVYRSDLSRVSLPAGVTVLPLSQAVTDRSVQLKKIFESKNPESLTAFQALNNALWSQGVYIEVAAKTTAADHLIHIVHCSSVSSKAVHTHPRTVIYQARQSEASVMESHLSVNDQGGYLVNALLDVYLEDDAVLNYCRAQNDGPKAFHISNSSVVCERAARFNGFTFTTTTGLTRNDLNALLNGEGSDATIRALYSAYGSQHVDNHTFVEHRVPNCTSNQLYKGILNDSARAVFNGKILVKPIAQQTNSYQLNKTLMLGKDARIDTKPQLEIFADDVKCTHGATIGHLDEDQMFYLQSRCISKDHATNMLARGFADDVLNYISQKDIQDKLHFLLEPSFKTIGA